MVHGLETMKALNDATDRPDDVADVALVISHNLEESFYLDDFLMVAVGKKTSLSAFSVIRSLHGRNCKARIVHLASDFNGKWPMRFKELIPYIATES